MTVPASGTWKVRERGHHITYLELLAVHRTVEAFARELEGRSVLLWEDNQAVMHIITNRTTRSPEMMELLRRLYKLLDQLGVSIHSRYIATDQNSLADALSRGSPFDELAIRDAAWAEIERDHGPHTADRYARASNTRATRWSGRESAAEGERAGALSQSWAGQNNFVFPPPVELPQIAQLLTERPQLQATVVAPYWPAQPWFQLLAEMGNGYVLHRALEMAAPPRGLHSSAAHALSGAMLACFRVEARRD